MEQNEKIIRFIEPIYRFCLNRLSDHGEAEDLAQEILVHVLDGIGKYEIQSVDAWVWRIAHNRYARWIESGKMRAESVSDEVLCSIADEQNFVDELAVTDDYQSIFTALHTLCAEYRELLVDYYIGEMPVKALTEKYGLPQTTVKWRLNAGRQKIKERMEDLKLDKIYKRINWNTGTCNGAMNPDQYLHTQLARAICEAAYDKPLSVEEISLATGIPALYVEDELTRLEYGDAVEKVGGKYAANFIVLRQSDRAMMDKKFAPLIDQIVECYARLFADNADKIKKIGFYGADFGMGKLGYIALPASLRAKIKSIKNGLPGLADGPYPPRKDGGRGWFIVEETADENEEIGEYTCGCNVAGDDDGSTRDGHLYYFHMAKYFDFEIYHNSGMRYLTAKNVIPNCSGGKIPEGLLSREETARLLQRNLIAKRDGGYALNFACFKQEQYARFASLFDVNDAELVKPLTDLILDIRRNFKSFVPKRLDSQINQWVTGYACELVGHVTEELIKRGVLEKPDAEKPLTNGVFYVEGQYIPV